MISQELKNALSSLQREALLSIARIEGLSTEKWKVERAMEARNFSDALKAMETHSPWYKNAWGRVQYWILPK